MQDVLDVGGAAEDAEVLAVQEPQEIPVSSEPDQEAPVWDVPPEASSLDRVRVPGSHFLRARVFKLELNEGARPPSPGDSVTEREAFNVMEEVALQLGHLLSLAHYLGWRDLEKNLRILVTVAHTTLTDEWPTA